MVYQYLDKQMTEDEVVAFEKLLSDDPFLSDALDGLKQIKQTDAIKDISTINVVNGKIYNNKTLYLVISSVVIVVFIVLTVVIFMKKDWGKKIEIKSLETIYPEANIDKPEGELLVSEFDSTLFMDSTTTEELDNTQVLIEQLKIKTEKTENNTEKKQVKSATKKESVRHSLEPLTSIPATVDHLQVTATPEKDMVKLTSDTVNRPLSDNSTNQMSVLVEGVTNEHDASGVSATLKTEGANAAPKPLGGFDLFNQYIDNNIQYPEIDGNQKRVSLKVQFKVSINGVPKNISVVRGSENDAFVSEAIRLVQNGPKWSPAIKDGKPVEQDVSIRIVFKP